jgi:tyrosinase
MKKIVIASVCLLVFFVAIARIIKQKHNFKLDTSLNNVYISCYPGQINTPSGSIKVFSNYNNRDTRLEAERKNVYYLTPSEQDSLRVAFARMKANTNSSNKKSWIYQTSLHGTTASTLKPLWNTSKYAHSPTGGNSYEYFLSWHRMYLYFFERILLSYQGDPDLRLPYWDPLDIPSDLGINDTRFPRLYADPTYDSFYIKKTNPNKGTRIFKTVVNPLYNLNRRLLPYPIRTADPNDSDEYDTYDNACGSANNKITYCDFLNSIEGDPHNYIHACVGGASGDMNDLKKAAKDPAFFLHHANIDRLWEKWIKKNVNNTRNPTSGNFAATNFYFYNERKNLYKIKGADIVDTRGKLKYFYLGINNSNNPSAPSSIADCCSPPQTVSQNRIMRSQTAHPITSNTSTISLNNFSITNTNTLLMLLGNIKVGQKVIVEFENVSINKFPDGPLNVFFLKEEMPLTGATSESFVGSLNLINTTMKHSPTDQSNIRVDITDVFKEMNLSINTIKKTKFVFKTTYPSSVQIPSISFKAINLLLETKD